MALIKCDDCGAEISSAAYSCPRCGRPTVSREPSSTRRRNWEVGTVIAALIGLLALFVSGYTAEIQREQVRAQVWPHLLIGYSDPERELVVLNKGVGPAQVRSVEISVDGRAQPDWQHVFEALGVRVSGNWQHSTLNGNVLSPGEKMVFMSLPTDQEYQQFRMRAGKRMQMDVCFCSTLDECWMHLGHQASLFAVKAVAACPRLAASERFTD